MSEWIAPLLALLASGTPVLRVTLAGVRGSAPREAGATLLLWVDAQGRRRTHGSIGGGRLEQRALAIGAQMLDADGQHRRTERYSLAASLAQCCGGVVELYWERFDDLASARTLSTAQRPRALRYCALDGSGGEWLLGDAEVGAHRLPAPTFSARAALLGVAPQRYFVERLGDDTTPLWLYGAGHVGQALMQVLAGLPFRVTWVDSRAAQLDQALAQARAALGGSAVPAGAVSRVNSVTTLPADDPADVAATAPAGAWHLVMTHSHQQDLEICAALLDADAFAFLGLIGSHSKDARFRHRLRQMGCREHALARLVCPIGVAGIDAKLPAAIAVSVAAQLLRLREAAPGAAGRDAARSCA